MRKLSYFVYKEVPVRYSPSLNERINYKVQKAPHEYEILTYIEETTMGFTQGKAYRVIDTDGSLIAILDDTGQRRWKSRNRFRSGDAG